MQHRISTTKWDAYHRQAVCPTCGETVKGIQTTRTYDDQRHRYHRCSACFDTFKSLEYPETVESVYEHRGVVCL